MLRSPVGTRGTGLGVGGDRVVERSGRLLALGEVSAVTQVVNAAGAHPGNSLSVNGRGVRKLVGAAFIVVITVVSRLVVVVVAAQALVFDALIVATIGGQLIRTAGLIGGNR